MMCSIPVGPPIRRNRANAGSGSVQPIVLAPAKSRSSLVQFRSGIRSHRSSPSPLGGRGRGEGELRALPKHGFRTAIHPRLVRAGSFRPPGVPPQLPPSRRGRSRVSTSASLPRSLSPSRARAELHEGQSVASETCFLFQRKTAKIRVPLTAAEAGTPTSRLVSAFLWIPPAPAQSVPSRATSSRPGERSP